MNQFEYFFTKFFIENTKNSVAKYYFQLLFKYQNIQKDIFNAVLVNLIKTYCLYHNLDIAIVKAKDINFVSNEM